MKSLLDQAKTGITSHVTSLPRGYRAKSIAFNDASAALFQRHYGRYCGIDWLIQTITYWSHRTTTSDTDQSPANEWRYTATNRADFLELPLALSTDTKELLEEHSTCVTTWGLIERQFPGIPPKQVRKLHHSTNMTASDSNSITLRHDLPAEDVEEVCGALTELDGPALAYRRTSLKTMLSNSLARYESVMSRRLPSLAPGVEIRILSGTLAQQTAVVQEADYIAERALIEVPDEPAQWVSFSALGPL